MGEPLTVKFTDKKGNPLLCIYEHWSGTESTSSIMSIALALSTIPEGSDTITIAKTLLKNFPKMGIVFNSTWYLDENNKPCMDELKQALALADMNHLREGINRSEGLIAITPNAINQMEYNSGYAYEFDHLHLTGLDCLEYTDVNEYFDYSYEEDDGYTKEQALEYEYDPILSEPITHINVNTVKDAFRYRLWYRPPECDEGCAYRVVGEV